MQSLTMDEYRLSLNLHMQVVAVDVTDWLVECCCFECIDVDDGLLFCDKEGL